MTVDEIISRFGTATAFGEAIGRNPMRAAEMRKRRSIPVRYWPALIEAARRNGFADITHEALVEAHAGRAQHVEQTDAAA